MAGSRTVNISWQDGLSPNPGNPPATSYDVLINNSLTVNVSTTSVFLNNPILLPFTNYSVTIVARNRVGVSNSSEPLLFMTTEARKLNICLPALKHRMLNNYLINYNYVITMLWVQYKYALLFLTAPGGPPQNVTDDLLDLGAVNISWSPPPMELHNGIITQYQVNYAVAGTNATITVSTVDLHITLTGLQNSTVYQIEVAAVNGAGISSFATVIASIPAPRKFYVDCVFLYITIEKVTYAYMHICTYVRIFTAITYS